jgi:hypothetical protein
MNRSELEFQIAYSSRLERMIAILLSRIDRVVTFAQILLGASVFAHAPYIPVGTLITVFAAYSFVYQPGIKSMQALTQKQKYDDLLAQALKLTDDELKARFYALQENDVPEIGELCHAAHMGEEIRLGHPPSVVLSKYERLVAWLAGDLPRLGTNPVPQ